MQTDHFEITVLATSHAKGARDQLLHLALVRWFLLFTVDCAIGRLDQDVRVPTKSTIHAVLDRHGLVRDGGPRRHASNQFIMGSQTGTRTRLDLVSVRLPPIAWLGRRDESLRQIRTRSDTENEDVLGQRHVCPPFEGRGCMLIQLIS